MALPCREFPSSEFDKLLDLHAQANCNPSSGAKELFQKGLAPIVDGRWEAVPWPAAV